MPSYSWISATVPKAGAPSRQAVSTGAPVGTSYGIDLTTWAEPGQTTPDLDPSFTLLDETSQRGVTEAAARRMCMPRGFLIDVPNEGFDIRSYLRKKWTRQNLFIVQSSCEAEAEKDERVYKATASVKWDEGERELVVRVVVDSMFGTFPLVLSIDDVTVAKLRQG